MQMLKRPIRISIGEDGNILVDPPAPEMTATDNLVWMCEHPFAIQFKTQSPVDEVRHKSRIQRENDGMFRSVPLTIRDGAQPGVYSYFVAVAQLGEDGRSVSQVHVHGSPDIIIKKPSGA